MSENIIFAVETSCDETACALYSEQRGLLAERVYSQWRRHAAYGGIVPEVASRDHLRRLLRIADDILQQHERPTTIAYTRGPGLAGALLAGAATAQALAFAWDLPLVAVNHLEGHLLSPLLAQPTLSFPYIALLVSGGHSQLWNVKGRGNYQLLGETLDDAAGEAFDKVAILLDLGYPGGARLERLAAKAAKTTPLPALPSPAQNRYDFSFSGLKTAARRLLGNHPPASIAAAFQQVVAAGLARQAGNALHDNNVKQLAVVGGVAQNRFIHKQLADCARRQQATLHQPERRHCGDNAAMIALAAVHQSPVAPGGGFDVNPRWQPHQPV